MQLLKALEAKKVLKKTLAAELKENEACDPEKLTEIRAYKILIMPQTLNGAHSIRLWYLVLLQVSRQQLPWRQQTDGQVGGTICCMCACTH